MTGPAHPMAYVGVAMTIVGIIWTTALWVILGPLYALLGAAVVSAGILLFSWGTAESERRRHP